MNIAWVLPCRFVEVHDNLATIVGGGIDTLWLPQLPGDAGVMLAIRLTGLAEEWEAGEEQDLVNRVRGPQDDLVAEVQGKLKIEATSARPDFLAAAVIPFVVQFPVAEEGTYTVEFIIGGAEAQVPLHVVQGQP